MFSSIAAVYAWGRRSSAGAAYLAAILMSSTIWSFGYAMELANTEKEAMYFWLRIQYLGVAFMPLWCLLFAFRYAGMDKWLTARSIAAMSAVPVITLILNWTNEWHGLFYSSIEATFSNGMTVLTHTKGIWSWMNIAYTYISILLMIFLLLRMSWRRGPLFRNQMIIIIAAALPTFGANIMYITGLNPFPNLDLSPFTFSVMGIVMIIGLFHYQMLHVMPVARDILIESMSDGILVLDNDCKLIDINPAAWQITGLSPSSAIGRDIDSLLPSWPEFLSFCRDDETHKHEIPGRGNALQCLDMRVIRLYDPQGNKRGRLIILRDITDRKQLEAEREDLILNLKEALARVKTLSGLLPICANCKKIRDDGGYWHQVDDYIHRHSGVDFSHGLCPECVKKLYPEISDKIRMD